MVGYRQFAILSILLEEGSMSWSNLFTELSFRETKDGVHKEGAQQYLDEDCVHRHQKSHHWYTKCHRSLVALKRLELVENHEGIIRIPPGTEVQVRKEMNNYIRGGKKYVRSGR